MRIAPKFILFVLAGLTPVSAIAANYCNYVYTDEKEQCFQQNQLCREGTIPPGPGFTTCLAQDNYCMNDAETDYKNCQGTSAPPPCTGPLCGIAYRPKATGKFDPNHLVLNLVFPTTPATTRKSAAQSRRSGNGS